MEWATPQASATNPLLDLHTIYMCHASLLGADHQQAVHLSFQKDRSFCGLSAAYTIALGLLTSAFDAVKAGIFTTDSASRIAFAVDVAESVSDVCRLLVELLGWDFSAEGDRYVLHAANVFFV
jgi:hypothetical protein